MDNPVGSQQQNIIIGTLLGDGFLERNGIHCRLVCDHSLEQEEYVRWKKDKLISFVSSITIKKRFDPRTDRTYKHCILRTNVSPSLEEYYNLFYRQKKKRIPFILPKIINSQILAVWIMDDGYKRNDCNALRLNTQSYPLIEQKIIRNSLSRLTIDSTIQNHKSKFVIYIPSRSMTKLRDLIRAFIIPSIEYKIA